MSGVVRLLCSVLGMSICAAVCAAPTTSKWEPYPTDAIRAIAEDRNRSDRDAVLALARILEDRIAMAKLHPGGQVRPTSGYEYAAILRMLVHRASSGAPEGDAIGALEELWHERTNEQTAPRNVAFSRYLAVALGLLRRDLGKSFIAELIEDSATPDEILPEALEATVRTGVPRTLLPTLLKLTEHPYSFVQSNDLGWPLPRRVYPVRVGACHALRQLGIQCAADQQPEARPDPEWNQVLSGTRISVDRKSVLEALRDWIMSDDEAVWREGLRAAGGTGGEDVEQLLRELAGRADIGKQKQVAVARALSERSQGH